MAEWFGVIGVIVSLIYLAKQIQHSIRQDTKNRIETTYLSFADIRKSLIESEELARIFTVGISEPDQLSEYTRWQGILEASTVLQPYEIIQNHD